MVERAAGVGSQNESLDNSAKLIHVLFETHPQGVFLCDSEGRLSDANPTFCAMTGIERPDLLGMGLAGIFSCFQLGQNSSLAPFAGNLDCALRMKDGVSHPVVIQFNEWAPGSWLGFVERQIPLIDNPLSQQNAVACVQNAPIAIYGINRDARIIEVNDFAQKMLGYTRAELLGMSIFQIDPIFNSKRWKENRGDLDFGAIRVFKTFHQRKDGSVFPVQITINRFISEGQEFSFAFAEDISLRTQAEVDLHGSQEMLRKVLDAFPGAVFWKDAHSVYLGCNQACARVAGLNDPEEIIGKHDRDLAWTDRQKIIFDSEDREVIETGMPILGKVESIRRPDGRLMWLSTDLFPLRDEQGKPIGLLGTTHDITERLQAENALKDAETFLLKSQSVSRTGSFSLDLRNLRWIGSPVMDELFGITADYPHDLEHWLKLIHPDQEAAMREYIEAETLSANPHYDTEFRLVRPGSGEELWLQAEGELEFDEHGAPLRVIGTVHDINGRKRADAAFQAHEREQVALIDTMTEINAEHDLSRLLEAILARAIDLVNADNGGIYLMQPDGVSLLLVTNFNAPKDYTGAVLRLGEGVAGKVAQTGETMIVQNYHTWAERSRIYDESQYQQVMGVPLKMDGRVIGVVSVVDMRAVASFSDSDIQLITLFSNQAAVAIHNAQLYNDAQRELTERRRAEERLERQLNFTEALLSSLPTPVFYTDKDCRYLGCNRAFTELLGFTSEQTRGKTVNDLWPSELAEIADRSDRVLLENKIHQTYETIMPNAQGELCNIIVAKDVYYDDAGQVAGLLGALVDVTELRQAERVQEALYRISSAALSAKNLETFYPQVHAIIRELIPVENFYIATYDEAKDLISFPYYNDEFDSLPPQQKPGHGLTEYLLKTGRPCLIDDTVFEKLRVTDQVDYTGTDSVDWLGAPLSVHQKIIGVMAVQSYDPAVRLNQGHLDVLAFVSNQVALAIERLQAESALQASEARYRLLFESSPVGILLVNPDGRVIDNNPMALSMLGSPSNEATRAINVLKFPPLVQAGISGELERCFREKRVTQCVGVYSSKWGKNVTAYVYMAPVLTLQGEVEAVQMLIDDITALKQVEETLRQTNTTLRTLIESAPLAVITLDQDHLVSLWNPAAEAMFGWKESEVLGKPLPYVPRHKAAEFKQLFQRTRTGESFTGLEVQRSRKDGTPVEISLSTAPLRDADGATTGTIGLHADITERKHTEKIIDTINAAALAMERAATPGQIFQSAGDALRKAGLSMVIFWLDGTKARLSLSYSNLSLTLFNAAEKLTGQKTADQTWPVDRFDFFYQAINDRRTAYFPSVNEMIKQMVPTGFEIFSAALVKLLKLKHSITAPLIVEGEVLGVIALESKDLREGDVPAITTFAHQVAAMWRQAQLFDKAQQEITARKLAEQQVRQLNDDLERRVDERTAALQVAMKELESFSYSVSHDLRAPLRAIDGFTYMLMSEYHGDLDAEGRRIAGIIRAETQRMSQLVDDLLAFSRISRTEMLAAPVDMKGIARSAFDDLTTQEDLSRIEFHLADLPPATGDLRLLYHVWTNLVSNAIKFTSKRERAVIEIGSQPGANPGEVVYFVRDNGAGFNPAYADKLFGVFQRLHNDHDFPGTGVGLAIVQRIIIRHGGRVWAEAAPDRGATFYFTVPLRLAVMAEKRD